MDPTNPLDPAGILAALSAIGATGAQPAPSASPNPDPTLVDPTVAAVHIGYPHPGSFQIPNPAGSPAPGPGPDGPLPGQSFLTPPPGGTTNDRIADVASAQLLNGAIAGSGAQPDPGQPNVAAVQMTPGGPTGPQAVQGATPSPAGSQPYLPNAANNEDAALTNEGIAAQNEAAAKTASDTDLANRKLAADQEYVNGLTKAQIDYRHQRAMAEAAANQETAAWLQKYTALSQQEPNPHRWWDNESGMGKALWLMGLAFSSAHAAITPGARNVALGMIQNEIDQDVQSQKDRLQRQMQVTGVEGRILQQKHQQNLTDLTDDHTMTLGRLQALHQAYMDKAAVPGDAQSALAAAQAKTWFTGKVAEVASSRAQAAARARQAEAERGLQWSIAKLNDKRARDIAAGSDQTRLDLAKVEAGEKLAAAQAKGAGASIHLSPDSGLRLVDAQGKLVGDGGLDVDKAMQPAQVMTQVQNANKQLYDLQKAKEALQGDGWFNVVTGTDPRLNQAMADLKMLESQGKLSHSSQALLDLYSQQISGLNPQGDKTDRVKAEAFKNGMLKELDDRIHNHVAETQNNLSGLPHPAGTHILYSPQSVSAPVTPTPTAAQEEADVGQYAPAQVYTPEQFTAAKAGDHPLKYNTEAETHAEAAFKGKSPAVISDLVSHWTDPYDTKTYKDFPYPDAKTGNTRLAVMAAADKAKAQAQEALDKFEVAFRSEAITPFSGLGKLAWAAKAGDTGARAELVRDVKAEASKYSDLTDLTDDDVMKILKDTGFAPGR